MPSTDSTTTTPGNTYLSVPEGVGGYPRLSALFGEHPELAIFRRFGRLNTLNILYLQAQLTTLERDLEVYADADSKSDVYDRQLYSQDWETMVEGTTKEDGDCRQWNTILEIRDVLEKYSDLLANQEVDPLLTFSDQALISQDTICRLSTPNKRDHDFLKDWMQHSSMGGVYLIGADRNTWLNALSDEFICLRGQKYDDWLSGWISDKIVSRFHQLIGNRFRRPGPEEHHSNMVQYSHLGVGRTASVLSIGMSSVLPLISIVALNFIEGTNKRIGIICCFTLLFSICLGLVTNAKSADVFAAAAAYAAVQVVFITGNNSDSGSKGP